MLTATFALAASMNRALSSLGAASSAPVDFASYGSVLAAVVAVIWALLERRERLTLQSQNERLSTACQSIVEHHYRERVQAEERHLLTHDSSMRNVLEHLERALLGKPKS